MGACIFYLVVFTFVFFLVVVLFCFIFNRGWREHVLGKWGLTWFINKDPIEQFLIPAVAASDSKFTHVYRSKCTIVRGTKTVLKGVSSVKVTDKIPMLSPLIPAFIVDSWKRLKALFASITLDDVIDFILNAIVCIIIFVIAVCIYYFLFQHALVSVVFAFHTFSAHGLVILLFPEYSTILHEGCTTLLHYLFFSIQGGYVLWGLAFLFFFFIVFVGYILWVWFDVRREYMAKKDYLERLRLRKGYFSAPVIVKKWGFFGVYTYPNKVIVSKPRKAISSSRNINLKGIRLFCSMSNIPLEIFKLNMSNKSTCFWFVFWHVIFLLIVICVVIVHCVDPVVLSACTSTRLWSSVFSWKGLRCLMSVGSIVYYWSSLSNLSVMAKVCAVAFRAGFFVGSPTPEEVAALYDLPSQTLNTIYNSGIERANFITIQRARSARARELFIAARLDPRNLDGNAMQRFANFARQMHGTPNAPPTEYSEKASVRSESDDERPPGVINDFLYSMIVLIVIENIIQNTTCYISNTITKKSTVISNCFSIIGTTKNNLVIYPCPININYLWNLGFILSVTMIVQVFTGLFLLMYYSATNGFESVIFVLKEVYNGFLLRYMHSNGTSAIVVVALIHMARGFYYCAYEVNISIWFSGVVILLLLIVTSFLGYILSWGQLSFWGATVIINLLSFISTDLVTLVAGDFCITHTTLKRFGILHAVCAGLVLVVVFVHIFILHVVSNSNTSGNRVYGKVLFGSHVILKDVFGFLVMFALFLQQVHYCHFSLSHHVNQIKVNSLSTPTHIVPEWYFLTLYILLKLIPSKTAGFLVIICLMLLLAVVMESKSVKVKKDVNINLPIWCSGIALLVLVSVIGSLTACSVHLFYARVLLYFLVLLIAGSLVGSRVLLHLDRPLNLSHSATSVGFIIFAIVYLIPIYLLLRIWKWTGPDPRNFISVSKNCNHKRLGLMYILVSLLMGIVGFCFSLIIRLELFLSGNNLICRENSNYYNLNITLHGLMMIFFIVMPCIYGGLGNYFVPIYLGVIEIIFSRVNNLSLMLLLVSYLLALYNVILEYAIGVGWTLYPPLSITGTVVLNILLANILLLGVSSLLSSVNYFVMIFLFHDYEINLFVLSILVTAVILIVILPILTGVLVLLLLDLHFNTIFFIIVGDPVLYQHLFWYFGHPEVYVLILPIFGIISQVASTLSQKTIFGYQSMLVTLICIAVFSNVIWGHHIYVVGLEIENNIYFTNITLIIALPTSIKIYNWLCIYLGVDSFNNLALAYMLMFIIIFIIGGITGIILSNNIIDIALHDTYYVVTHFHYVLSIAIVIALISAVLFLQKIMINCPGLLSNLTAGKYYLASLFVTNNSIFLPLYFLGFNLLPRRVSDYCDNINGLSYLSGLGIVSLAALLITKKII